VTADLNTRTVGGLLAYCEWLITKGYATTAQVNPWRTAIHKVFDTVESEDWQSLDLSAIDLDEYLSRFQTLAGAQYKAESIATYGRRIRNAVEAQEHYLTTGRPPMFRQSAKRTGAEDKGTASKGSVVKLQSKASSTANGSAASSLIEFPFPLKNGRMAILRLPARLHSEDVNRLSGFLRTLQDDAGEQRQLSEQTGEDSEAA
jgi:hypothetical protein